MRQLIERQHGSIGMKAKDAAELVADVLDQATPACGDGPRKQISCVLVETHERPLIRIRLFDFNKPASFSRMPASHESKSAAEAITAG